jgi:hypothetical protein
LVPAILESCIEQGDIAEACDRDKKPYKIGLVPAAASLLLESFAELLSLA